MNRLALIALAIGSFGIGTSEFASMGLLQLFAKDFGTGIPEATHAITAYALGVVVGAPVVTLAAARLNRLTLLILLMMLFTFGNLLSGLAGGLPMLIVSRFLTGLQQGAYFGAGAMVATYIVGPAKDGKAFALVVSGLTIATIIGAPIGTFVGQQFGWRVAYLAFAVYGLIALISFHLWLPRSAALDGRPILQEVRALARWNVWALLAIATIGTASVFAVYTFIGPLVTSVAGLPPTVVPIALALFGVGMASGNMVGGRLADTYRYRGMVTGLTVASAVLVVLGLGGAQGWILLLCLFALGFTFMIAIPTIPARLTAMAPEGPALVGAMNMAAFNLANAIGAAAGGAAMGAGYGLLSPVWVGLALTLLGLLLFALVARKLLAPSPHR